jgi:uncharacterized protein YcfJ
MENFMNTTLSLQRFAFYRMPVLAGLLLPALLATGCASSPNATAGAVGGGLFGGLMGGLVGAAVGGPRGALVGAGIGAAAGGTAGGLNGAAEDEREQRAVKDVQAAYAIGQQELQEVAKLAQAGNPDTIIIGHIRNSGGLFNLSTEQITYLRTYHVSDNVIAYMQSLGAPQPGYGGPPGGVVVIEQPPPPPVGGVVIVGGGYGRRW